jgi:Sap, sulfolipid-1-addressing protein
MTGELLAAVGGLALLDSLNPATIVGMALILLLPGDSPVLKGAAFVTGALLTVLGIGVGIYFGAGAAAEIIANGLVWLRRLAFGLAALALLWSAFRRLRSYHRRPIALPAWLSVGTAAPFGVLVTAADLPNAFPYFIAIERLIAAEVPTGNALLVLAGYAVVYCLPCLILLAAGALWGERIRTRLQGLFDRFGTARVVARNVPAAVALTVAAVAVAGVAVGV